ncbi:VOC family protein [Winogradskya consettensis]|nr:VOC family protein [Actinoplanes consettensis]
MSERPQMILAGVVLDSPDAQELAAFYQRLLGWNVVQDEPDWVKLGAPDAGPGLSFQTEPRYERPVWPAGPDDPQMSVHLDIHVTDLDEAGAHAEKSGAIRADYQPQEDVWVYLDPAGHPFCLFL